jgi:hypothetical protein
MISSRSRKSAVEVAFGGKNAGSVSLGGATEGGRGEGTITGGGIAPKYNCGGGAVLFVNTQRLSNPKRRTTDTIKTSNQKIFLRP